MIFSTSIIKTKSEGPEFSRGLLFIDNFGQFFYYFMVPSDNFKDQGVADGFQKTD